MELKVSGRQIESPLQAVGNAGDHVELAFHIPRYYDGKDLSSGTSYLIVSKSGESKTYYMEKQVLEDTIIANW